MIVPFMAFPANTVDRGVQPTFAYIPHLDFGEIFGEKSILDGLTATYKIGF